MQSINAILRLADQFEKIASNQYAYHIKNDNFKGKFIYPLSELEEVYPAIYKQEVKKYQGRRGHPVELEATRVANH